MKLVRLVSEDRASVLVSLVGLRQNK
jgi:hypothetical protein